MKGGMFSVSVSKLVEQFLATSEKPRRLGFEKKGLAPVKVNWHSQQKCVIIYYFFTGNYALKDFNQAEECCYVI